MNLLGQEMSYTRKIAYLAVVVALCAVVNMFSIDIIGIFKLSFVTAMCIIAGYLFGPILGGAVAFLGDLLGFLMMPSAVGAYSPYIGMINALFAVIAGVVYMLMSGKHSFAVATIIAFVIGHIVCTMFLNTWVTSALWSTSGFWPIFWKRVLFQTPVNIVNCLVAIYLIKGLSRIGGLKLTKV